MHPAYPTALELQAELENCGLFSSDWNLNLVRACSIAREAFERDVDWNPYLADVEESDRRFTLRGQSFLQLGAAFIGAPSLIQIDDAELAVGERLVLQAPRGESGVTTALRFEYPAYSRIDGLIVIARWGRVAQLSEIVWQGVLMRAALNLGTQIRTRKTAEIVAAQNENGLIKAKASGPVRIEYQLIDGLKQIDFDATFAGWAGAYDDALAGRVMRQP